MEWRLFIKFGRYLALVLICFIFSFRGTRHSAFIGAICLIGLGTLALIGFARSFSIRLMSKNLQPAKMTSAIPENMLTKATLTLILTFSLFLLPYFGWTIFGITSASSNIELSNGSVFTISKPGIYTIWKDCNNKFPPYSQASHGLKIYKLNNGMEIPIKWVSNRVVRRSDGGVFLALGDCLLRSNMSYKIVTQDDFGHKGVILKRKISVTRLALMVLSAFSGIVLALLALYSFIKIGHSRWKM